MLQNLVNAVDAQALRAILVQQLHDQVLCVARHRDAMTHWVREADGAFAD